MSNITKSGMSIFYILPKGIDVLMYALVQAVATISGLKVGNKTLQSASSVKFVEGYLTNDELRQEVDNYITSIDISKLQLHSTITSHDKTKNTVFDPMKPITDSKTVGKFVGWAQKEENPFILFHNTASLTVNGKLCKVEELGDLHDRLKWAGATQLFFVSKETDVAKISARPDLVFSLSSIHDEELPTIRATLKSATARFQGTVMPIEWVLDFQKDGSWLVAETNRTKMQDEAIKGLGFAGFNRKQIARKLGGIDATTVGRHLKVMEANGEVILSGHDILPPKES